MKSLFLIFFLASLALNPVVGSEAETASERNERILKSFHAKTDVVYKQVGEKSLKMILFLPDREVEGPMPVMLYTHGGGWGGGSKYKIFGPVFLSSLRQILDQGIACAAIDYRLTRKGQSNAIDCVVDCKDAARFLIKHADTYNLDTNRMGVWGGSAGGHLALMTGLAANDLFPGDSDLISYDPKFRCILAYYPATTFLNPELLVGSNFENPGRMVPMIGGLAKDFPERAKLLSPTEHLRADSPPTLLLHGDEDQILPIGLSQYYMECAEAIGADAELITVHQARHGFSGANRSPSMEAINRMAADYILRHLKPDSIFGTVNGR
ncbi:alpha/beta hydrolase [Coraliomargarita parva]|uniref:alpha/beta hydrolase n=1 Tax=Coraliomargarita parva TaxID=3014050 RepID=UPI0022B4BC94|nr:alpha/beta hydrolase [Coraliomargarita parva]